MMSRLRLAWPGAAIALALQLFKPEMASGQTGSVRGTVVDSQGAVVSGANVRLLQDNEQVAQAPSDARGEFRFESLPEGRYQIEVTAAGFETRVTDPTFVGAPVLRVALSIGPLRQDVVVTAAATELPESQVGAAVTLIDSPTLQALGKVDVLEPLRTVPGVQVIQTGSRGGSTSLFVRGGDSDFNKILVDGVPANDIGGSFDFAQLATAGVESIEVLREANSVLYGSDALSGVVNITTRRGRTRIPEGSYSIDGGNLNTLRNAAAIGGVARRFDYFSEISHFRTDNDLANNDFRNTTYAGRFGAFIGTNTDLSGTIRHTDTRYESPNAFSHYGIPDDSAQDNDLTYLSVTSSTQVSERFSTTVKFGYSDQQARFENLTPTGEPSAFGDYLGDTVTIRGANGYSVTGRAILDYGFGSYPSVSESSATRNLVSGQVDYRVGPAFDVSGGGRYEHEEAFNEFGFPPEITRNNGGGFVEGRLSLRNRVYVSGGVGIEHNAVFGTVATPRVSVAAYLRSASSTTGAGETKLTLNAGRGIKAPTLFDEQGSLFAIVPDISPAFGSISPIGPERSRTFDVGIEQGFWRGRSRVRVSYFNNDFRDMIEFVNKSVLPALGVPPDVAAATAFGATVNSKSFTAQGVETSVEVAVGRVEVLGSYTFLDAEITESFTGGVLEPAYNPAFPDIPIGQFSPLVGARPFRRPKNAGSLMVSYVQGRAQVALAGSFAGKRDGSTFLSDEFYGYSMLLPNHNLEESYQKVDLSGSYRFHRSLRWYLTLENMFNEKYEAAAGHPALPATVRTGVTISFGGASTP
jgi:iron complex outermembrane receptor protein/vitamin B12 transporter